ncbi:MAG: carbamoyltransferase HypF [Chitinispirillaceae bacterium]|nr:carbamoyltransferase HypF [Chitinispirillaceae bacterium]
MKSAEMTPTFHRISIKGTIQGVGFRPFVYRLAREMRIRGTVGNNPGGVLVNAYAPSPDIRRFCKRLVNEAPPLAAIVSIDCAAAGTSDYVPDDFTIVESQRGDTNEIDIARDATTCEACLREMSDPADRRFRHPFINCTDCGPRYTIMRSLPYDRQSTTMAGFPMCSKCRAEYDDPASRRFHAQPICCPDCGPRLVFLDAGGNRIDTDDPIAVCCNRIEAGAIAAVKGIGGYHLACRADREETVQLLRARKDREEKPFALMARDLAMVDLIAELSTEDRRLLESIERPIVLCRKRPDTGDRIADAVAPGLSTLGIMLPYTPVHYLLFKRSRQQCLVMTSANRSEEPMVHDDAMALRMLAGIADCYLTHDRPILVRTDDSIARVAAGAPLLLRRGRGYVPEPLPAPCDVTGIIGSGGVLKSTVAVGRGRSCYLSQYIGNVERVETLEQLDEIKSHLTRALGVSPSLFAVDLHPHALPLRIAPVDVPLVRVQHHHAHAAACMAENGCSGPTACLVFDGTGYGDDGTIWGSEIVLASYTGYERIGHLIPLVMPGGDAAVRHPWRMAMGALYPLLKDGVADLFSGVPRQECEAVLELLHKDVSCVRTSGMGRLFDCLSALLGVCIRSTYEGQPAQLLEGVADPEERGTYEVSFVPGASGQMCLDGSALLLQALEDKRRGSSVATVSARFHLSIACAAAHGAEMAARKAGSADVVISGGCFQNAILLEHTVTFLKKSGLRPVTHRMVPPNDESIAYGQLVIAGAMAAGNK